MAEEQDYESSPSLENDLSSTETFSTDRVIEDEQRTLLALRMQPSGEGKSRGNAGSQSDKGDRDDTSLCRPTALCLSGGGARSATFALGVLQALAKREGSDGGSWLNRFTYLSTVSGGGFIGGWLTRWRTVDRNWSPNDLKEAPDGFREDPEELHRIRRLRNFSNYLSPTLGLSQDTLGFVSSFLRKLLLNLVFWSLLFVAVAFAVRIMASLYAKASAVAGIDPVEILLVAFGGDVEKPLFGSDPLMHLAISSIALLIFSYALLSLGSLLASLKSWISEERYSAFSGTTLAITLVVAAVIILFGVIPELIWDRLSLQQSSGARLLAFVTLSSGAVAAASGFWSRLPSPLQQGATKLTTKLKGVYLDIVSLLALSSLAVAAGYFVRWLSTDKIGNLPLPTEVITTGVKAAEAARDLEILRRATPNPEASATTEGLTAENPPQTLEAAQDRFNQAREAVKQAFDDFRLQEVERYSDLWQDLSPWFVATVIIAMILALLAGANRSSLHSVYANRLIRAYLGTTRTGRQPKWPTDYDELDDIPLSQVEVERNGRPLPLFPVINMTMNLKGGTGEKGRKGASFTATPLHVGSATLGENGYVRTGQAVRSTNNRGMTLGRAMTISGAAASPNMGYYGRALVAFAMSILNIRLGWWFPNPAKLPVDQEGQPKALAFEPKLGAVYYALKEAFGSLRSNDKWLYLSDGGHFDNLGLYEMVRRRCHEILIIDAGCDGAFEYEDLLQTVRWIKIDFGIEIELPPILPGQKGSRPDHRVLMAPIKYSKLDEGLADGHLVLIKPMVTSHEPPGMLLYRERSRSGRYSFPHHSTADQFFDEEQFENYRDLGYRSATDGLAAFPENSFKPQGSALTAYFPKFMADYYPELPKEIEQPSRAQEQRDDNTAESSGLVTGFLSIFKGDSVGEIMAKVAGIVAASTITYGATDKLADTVGEGVGKATSTLVDTPTEDDGVDEFISQLLVKKIYLPVDGSRQDSVTYNYFAPPIVDTPELPDSIRLDEGQMAEIRAGLGLIRQDIVELEIEKGSGLSSAELDGALAPINADLDRIIALVRNPRGGATNGGARDGDEVTEEDLALIRGDLEELRSQLAEATPNFSILQDQIDYLILRIDRAESDKGARGI